MIDWLIRRAQRTPYFHLAGYMNRWWLVPFENRGSSYADGCARMTWRRPIAKVMQLCGIAARVHQILRSDEGRDPHDHPWPYLTIVLRGGYWEDRFTDEGIRFSTKWHGPGSVIFRPANSWHMLALPAGQSAWTLFMTGRYQQKWGFNTPTGKVPYDVYLKAKHGN